MAQPRQASSVPAGSFHPKAPPTAVTSCGPRVTTQVSSPPVARRSSPTQLFTAEGVMVYRVVQPGPGFSSESGGKKAPTRARMVNAGDQDGW